MSFYDTASTSFDSFKAATSDHMTESSTTSTFSIENRSFANGSNQKLNIAMYRPYCQLKRERPHSTATMEYHSLNPERSAL